MWDLFGTKGGGFRDLEPGVKMPAPRSYRASKHAETHRTLVLVCFPLPPICFFLTLNPQSLILNCQDLGPTSKTPYPRLCRRTGLRGEAWAPEPKKTTQDADLQAENISMTCGAFAFRACGPKTFGIILRCICMEIGGG